MAREYAWGGTAASEDKLIIDELIYDPHHCPRAVVVRIEDKYLLLPKNGEPREYHGQVNDKWMRGRNHDMMMWGCKPRDGA
jgi:hypothetical protein